jgi:1,2-diacylglycerol 3-alpha-glucosyltransferase
MKKNKLKVAILFRRVGPYHLVRIKALLSRFSEIFIIEGSGKDKIYAWETVQQEHTGSWITLFPENDTHFLDNQLVARMTHDALASSNADVVVIPGWSENIALAALHWCRLNLVPAVVTSDSQYADRPRNIAKELIKRRILRHFSSAICAGSPHVEYLTRLGMEKRNIFTRCDVIDNEYFRNGARSIRKQKQENRERFNLPADYFLTSCRFISEKNIPALIEAYARYKKKAGNKSWKLVLLGDGGLRPDIEQTIEVYAVKQDVVLPGFVQYHELPVYYALAHCFILCSISESWGLVVNEAMASGLPVLVSNRCGCAADLVKQGENGFTFNPLDTEEISELMLKMSTRLTISAAMGRQSEKIIKDWSPDKFVYNLERAVNIAADTAQPPLRRIDSFLLNLIIRK